MSNMGKWDGRYGSLVGPEPYGTTESYRIGAEFLRDCATVEDWGAARGGSPPSDRRGI